jgi:NADPH-dependent 2,4-dienoyl-CoA reductase/sulfur reductase-like enzyme
VHGGQPAEFFIGQVADRDNEVTVAQDVADVAGPQPGSGRRCRPGRVAGENARGGTREFAGSLGTQVVKIFDQAAARTGLRDHEATAAGYHPVTIGADADDHKAYYPGSHRIRIRFTGDRATGRLLGVQLFGHKNAEIAKRIDTAATAIYSDMTVDAISDLDLSYTPPPGSPWDAIQAGAQAWVCRARTG